MESEKIKEIKETLKRCGSGKDGCCWGCSLQDTQNIAKCTTVLCDKALTLINELESENERLSSRYRNLEINYNDTWEHYREYEVENQQLKDRIAELEEGIAKSMLGCEFLPECTKEIAEKIWNIAKITVDATKHIVQGREYLHLDTLKEIVKSCGVEIKE